MSELRKGLSPLPRRMRSLPIDERGYPVPWFVAWIDGKPDFRVIRPGGVVDAVRRRRCWICGETTGRYGAFVIGPMCAINRVSSEPPSHRDCAEFAVRACPFLVRPAAKRREARLPESTRAPAGLHIERNPGVALLWVSRDWAPFRGKKGALIHVGTPEHLSWWREGRPATRAEVVRSIETGYPILAEAAGKDRDPKAALRDLERMRDSAMKLVPAA